MFNIANFLRLENPVPPTFFFKFLIYVNVHVSACVPKGVRKVLTPEAAVSGS